MRYVVTHPANIDMLKQLLQPQLPVDPRLVSTALAPGSFCGMPIHTNTMMPRFVTRWFPPQDRFFEYDESDYGWLKYFGYGTRIETDEPLFMEMTI